MSKLEVDVLYYNVEADDRSLWPTSRAVLNNRGNPDNNTCYVQHTNKTTVMVSQVAILLSRKVYIH